MKSVKQPRRLCDFPSRMECEPLIDRDAYRQWLAHQPMRRPMRKAPNGYQYPRSERSEKFYTAEERQEIVSLVAEGWWPFDVAAAYGIPMYRFPRSRTQYGASMSGIYKLLERWQGEDSNE